MTRRTRTPATVSALLTAALLAALAAGGLAGCSRPSRSPGEQAGLGRPSGFNEPSAVESDTDIPPPLFPSAEKIAPPAKGAYLGVYSPPSPFDAASLEEFEADARREVAIEMWYQPWAASNRSLFDTGTVVAVWRQGKVPMITWEPWDPGTDANQLAEPSKQPTFTLSAIVSGKHDAYIRSWASSIAQLGGPVMLRPMHEMNGFWYPWSGTANGNEPAEFVAAWRRIHDIFRQEGASNVTWVWSINHESVPKGSANGYAAYYPGDEYVDWTAISGFNFGTTSSYSAWEGYQHWYAKPLAYLKTLKKPICIAEFGTVEEGGSKAAWLRDAYQRIRAEKRIKAVVYFDSREGVAGESVQDWRIATSPASVRAFRESIASAHFLSNTPPELESWAGALDRDQRRFLYAVPPVY